VSKELDQPKRSSQQQEITRLRAKVAQQETLLAETRVSLNLLYESSETLAELLDPVTLAQRALDMTCAELAVLRGEFFEVTVGGHLTLLATSGYEASLMTQLRQQVETRLQRGLAWTVLQADEPVVMRDTTCNEKWIPVPGIDDGICSAAGLPLHIDNELVGVICLLSDEQDFFTEDRLPFLLTLVTPVALALQNARLYAAEKEARETAELLRTANLAFADTLDPNKLFHLTLGYLGKLLAYDCATLLLRDHQMLIIAAQRDLSHQADAAQADAQAELADSTPIQPLTTSALIPLGNYLLLQKILTTKEPILISDVNQLPEPLTIPAWHCGRSWLGLPLVTGGEAVGLLIVERSEAESFTQKQCGMAEALAVQIAVAIHNANLFQEVQIGQQQLRLLTEQLINAQEEERRTIALELHDEAGQMLTALKVNTMTLANELALDNVRALEQFKTVHQLIDQTMARIRQLAYGLRPPELDTVGLDVALELLCEEFTEQMGIAINYQGRELPQLAEAASISFYRFVQEALTNSAKHAEASTVSVALDVDETTVSVTVRDDGRGFTVPNYSPSRSAPLGLGLLGMSERFEALRGQVRIHSTPGEGTTLQAIVPLAMAYADYRESEKGSCND